MEKRSRGNGRLCDAGRVRIILAGVPLVIPQMAGAAESADVCRWLGRRLGWPNCYRRGWDIHSTMLTLYSVEYFELIQ